MKSGMTDLNLAIEIGGEKLGCARAQHHAIGMLRETVAIALEPFGLLNARVSGCDSEASDNRMPFAGDNPEQHWIRMRHKRPAGDLCSRVCRNIAEEKVGDISLEDDNFAVVRE